jgi:hypothetical protein
VSGGQPLAEGAVDLDGLVGDLVEEVGSPVPVQAGGIERVERGGQQVAASSLVDGADKVRCPTTS